MALIKDDRIEAIANDILAIVRVAIAEDDGLPVAAMAALGAVAAEIFAGTNFVGGSPMSRQRRKLLSGWLALIRRQTLAAWAGQLH